MHQLMLFPMIAKRGTEPWLLFTPKYRRENISFSLLDLLYFSILFWDFSVIFDDILPPVKCKYFWDILTTMMHFQVQTTAKALAETRDKLIEEEKKKQMKDSSRSFLSLNILLSEEIWSNTVSFEN